MRCRCPSGVDGSPNAARAAEFSTPARRSPAADPRPLLASGGNPRTARDRRRPARAGAGLRREAAALDGRRCAANPGRGPDRLDGHERQPGDALHTAGERAQSLVVGDRGAGGVTGLLLASTAINLAPWGAPPSSCYRREDLDAALQAAREEVDELLAGLQRRRRLHHEAEGADQLWLSPGVGRFPGCSSGRSAVRSSTRAAR
jgi:nucleotide-binding universal stress UspA family protein